MLYRLRTIFILKDLKIVSLVQKLWWVCQTGQIGCYSKDIHFCLSGPAYCTQWGRVCNQRVYPVKFILGNQCWNWV